MVAGKTGTFVISWSQTELDGLRGAPASAIDVGATWRWSGAAVRIDGPDDVMALGSAAGTAELRRRAARAARRMFGATLPPVRPQDGHGFEGSVFGDSFAVTDGRTAYPIILVHVPEAARPLLVFAGTPPPRDTDLWVSQGVEGEAHLNRISDTPTGVICFAKGTVLRTPGGDRRVEDLAEGDAIDTKDGGAQDIVWIGARRMTGARLYAMPELRPVRIRSGALGNDDPRGDLIVSPRHRVLVAGPVAQALFNTDEVLVAAEDLVNDRSVIRDHGLKAVTYIHLLLPRHHVVWANGVETESFHPASTDLATVDPDQRRRLAAIIPGIEADPHCYGATARRELNKSEAAILCHEAPVTA
ncbi:MAG: Hint domain-containing protein [Pseudomonadota bacterium]